jgi:CTP:molybdopterin cytidylyltransferase MocA
MIPAVILAAGRSERMRRSKALLPIGESGDTFIARLISTFRSAESDDVIVVLRPDDVLLRTAVEYDAARIVENPDADRGQLSSVIAGLDAVDRPGVNAILVMPVDIPLVRVETIRAVKAAFLASAAPVARAVHEGRHGHPVIFARRVFDELRRADPHTGARAVVHAHAHDLLNVEVDDPGILRDVDTPDDYDQMSPRSSA